MELFNKYELPANVHPLTPIGANRYESVVITGVSNEPFNRGFTNVVDGANAKMVELNEASASKLNLRWIVKPPLKSDNS